MLTIKHLTYNEYFELDNVKIPLHIFNPFFAENGSLSFSAKMPAKSAINQRLCDYPNQPGKPNNSGFSIAVELNLLGATKRCTMDILGADEKDIKWNLNLDEGAFIATYGEKNIQDFDYGGEQNLPGRSEFMMPILPSWDHAYYQDTYPEVNCQFPLIYNPNFFDGSEYEEVYSELLKCHNLPVDLLNIYDTTENGERISFAQHVISPCPFLLYIIDQIAKQLGYKIDSNFFSKDEFKNIIILTARDNYRNTIIFDPTTITENKDVSKYFIGDYIPSFSIKNFIKHLKNKFNTHWFINEEKKEISIHCLDDSLKEPVTEDLSEFFSKPILKKITQYTSYSFIDSGNHTSRYEALFPDERKFADKILSGIYTEENLNNGTYKLNDVILVHFPVYEIYFYYQLQEIDDGEEKQITWTPLGYKDFGNIYSSLLETEKELKIESKATISPYTPDSMPLKVRGEDYATKQIYVKTINLPVEGYSELLQSDKKDIGLTLAFYNAFNEKSEMVETPEGGYQNAAAGNVNRLNAANNTLYYAGEKGLYNKCWKKTIDIKMNRGKEFEAIPSLPVDKLLSFDASKKYIIHGGVYYIKTIKAVLNNEGVSYEKSLLIEV